MKIISKRVKITPREFKFVQKSEFHFGGGVGGCMGEPTERQRLMVSAVRLCEQLPRYSWFSWFSLVLRVIVTRLRVPSFYAIQSFEK